MLDNLPRSLSLNLVAAVCLLSLIATSFGCSREEELPSSRAMNGRYSGISATQATYQSAVSRLREMRSEVQKYDHICNTAEETNRDIIDQRVVREAGAKAYQKAELLNHFASECLAQQTVIREVSSAHGEYRSFLVFSEKMMAKYSRYKASVE